MVGFWFISSFETRAGFSPTTVPQLACSGALVVSQMRLLTVTMDMASVILVINYVLLVVSFSVTVHVDRVLCS